MLAKEHQPALYKERFGGVRSAVPGAWQACRMWLLAGLVQRLPEKRKRFCSEPEIGGLGEGVGNAEKEAGDREEEAGEGSSRLLMLLERPCGCNSGFGALSQRDCLPRSPVQGELR